MYRHPLLFNCDVVEKIAKAESDIPAPIEKKVAKISAELSLILSKIKAIQKDKMIEQRKYTILHDTRVVFVIVVYALKFKPHSFVVNGISKCA